MKFLDCLGLSLLVVLGGCDADKSPAPPPKVATPTSESQAEPAADVKPAAAAIAPESLPAQKASAPVHALAPNISAVSVVAPSKPLPASKPVPVAKTAAIEKKAPSANAKSAKIKADNAEVANRPNVASKTKAPAQVVKDTHLSKPNLDLSLPPEMVKQLTPPSQVITATTRAKVLAPAAKPLLPKMFAPAEGDPDFQLQGRLLSNEMQLQLRNESRREVEGAAVDFTFKQ